MESFLKRIKNIGNELKETFLLIIEIWELIIKNRILVLLLIFLITYLLVRNAIIYFAITRPQEIVANYYDHINNRNYEKAWIFVDTVLRKGQWDGDFQNFKKGYSSPGVYSTIQISAIDDLKNVWKAFFNKERNYDVSLEKNEIVKIQNFKADESWHNFRNASWMQLYFNVPLKHILNGSHGNTINYVKFYQIKVKLIKVNGYWKIVKIDKIREGLNYTL